MGQNYVQSIQNKTLINYVINAKKNFFTFYFPFPWDLTKYLCFLAAQ